MTTPEEFPEVSGYLQLTGNWALTLPSAFRRRIEDGNLVLWRPGLTFWIDAYGNEEGQSIETRMAHDRVRISEHARNLKEARTENVAAISYELSELAAGGQVQDGLFTLMHGAHGRIILAAYYESPENLAIARQVSTSLTYTGAPLQRQ